MNADKHRYERQAYINNASEFIFLNPYRRSSAFIGGSHCPFTS